MNPAAPSATYRKHDSFVGLRHRAPVSQEAVWARIRSMLGRMDEIPMSEEARGIVRQACAELLGNPGEHEERFRLHSYVVEEMSRLTDEELPRYLGYRFRYEMFPRRLILDGFPPCLQIEPTSICNYRCVFCYQSDERLTTRRNGHMGMMSLSLFKRLIDQAHGRCEAVTLASRGEPLLCPDLEAMLAYARGKFLALKMNTNASRLNEPLCHAILQAEVQTLVFSVDAASEPAYSQFRRGGHLEGVLKNIARFRDIRTKRYPHSRVITRISGVKVPGTPGLDELETFWGELVDQVAFVAYNPWEHIYERPLHDLSTPCSDLWRRMFVWWDGLVNPCDSDYQSTLAVGSAMEQDLDRLWRCDRYQQLRRHHRERQRSHCSPCNRCPVV